MRLALHGRRFLAQAEPMVWTIVFLMAEALLRAGHETIIADETCVTARRRARWIELADRLGATVELHVVETSPALCIRRAEAENDTEIPPVIHRMAHEWDLPIPEWWIEDGFAPMEYLRD